MTKQEIEKYVDQMSSDQLREYAILGVMFAVRILSKIINGKGSQGKP